MEQHGPARCPAIPLACGRVEREMEGVPEFSRAACRSPLLVPDWVKRHIPFGRSQGTIHIARVAQFVGAPQGQIISNSEVGKLLRERIRCIHSTFTRAPTDVFG
jgi:hypothetical protein